MWPTSIAGCTTSRPPHSGHTVAVHRLADIGKAGLVVAPGLDAAHVPAVTVRACDELTLAQRLVHDDFDGDAERPDRAAVRRRVSRSPPRVAGLKGGLEDRHPASPRSDGRRLERSTSTRRSPTTTGIAFDVAAGSMLKKDGEGVDRCPPPASRPRRAHRDVSGNSGVRGIPTRGLDVGEVVARSRSA